MQCLHAQLYVKLSHLQKHATEDHTNPSLTSSEGCPTSVSAQRELTLGKVILQGDGDRQSRAMWWARADWKPSC